ncbi:Toxin SymE, type I toxin-antitoxin system [Lachnospiraceae bacterium XBB1006]|nr:Toxin SymE, type I toxin-antitoxin system [Lachnospiraceae bacterium XBB1006]
MANKNMRTVKIYGMSGYKYQATPTIMLKGKWLEELGFEIGDYITVSCEDAKQTKEALCLSGLSEPYRWSLLSGASAEGQQ